MMIQDFNLVPIVKTLNETANLEEGVFWTSDAKKCNILFKILDENDKYII